MEAPLIYLQTLTSQLEYTQTTHLRFKTLGVKLSEERQSIKPSIQLRAEKVSLGTDMTLRLQTVKMIVLSQSVPY